MDLSPLDQALGRIFGDSGTPDSRDVAEQGARDEIAEAFALIRTLPAARIAVPCVEVKFNGIRVCSMSLDAVIRDLVTDGHGGEQLLAVLQASDCPLVQKLREELCAQWQRQWASDIAEARQ